MFIKGKTILNIDALGIILNAISMKKHISLLLPLLTIFGIFSPFNFVMAHSTVCTNGSSNDYTSGADCLFSPYTGKYTFIEQSGVYLTDSKNMKWGTKASKEVKNSGHKYTQDNTDGSSCNQEHFSATGDWKTNFPNPKFDMDNDTWYAYPYGCYSTNEEAEITADSANFPTAEYNYWTSITWKRKYLGTGHMYFTAQPSNYSTTFKEWQSQHNDLLFDQYYDNGHLIAAQSVSAKKDQAPVLQQNIFSKQDTLFSYGVLNEGKFSEMNVDVDFNISTKDQLLQYIKENNERISKLTDRAGSEPIKAVVTFNKPISQEQLAEISGKEKFDIVSFEARVVNSKGEKITLGGVSNNGKINPKQAFTDAFQSKDFQFLGITSLEAVVPKANIQSLNTHPYILLLDVLPGWVEREVRAEMIHFDILKNSPLDVNINDLYWTAETLKI